MPEQEFELFIERQGHDGRGIGHQAGKIVFVEGALAGETVTACITRQHSRFDEARCLSVKQASPDRISPACEYYDRCGGCGLQHLSVERQRAVKQQALYDQLERFGGQQSITLSETLSGEPWGYRRKARLGVKWNRHGELIIGFREKGSAHLVALKHCAVLHPDLSALLPSFYTLIPELESRKTIGHLELAHSDRGAALVVRHLKTLSHHDKTLWLDWAETHQVQLFWQSGEADTLTEARREAGKLTLLSRDQLQPLQYVLHGLDLSFLPNDFVQVNPDINRRMVAQALDWLQLKSSDQVLDLFAGFGNFSLPVAKQVASVTGVEGEKSLVERARANAERNGISNAVFEVGDLSQSFKGLRWAKKRYNVLLLDPPRTGAQEICRQASQLGAEKILYVSCNPSTLARDSALLAEQGYRLVKAGIMDMFPQTSHVESMVLFERSTRPKPAVRKGRNAAFKGLSRPKKR